MINDGNSVHKPVACSETLLPNTSNILVSTTRKQGRQTPSFCFQLPYNPVIREIKKNLEAVWFGGRKASKKAVKAGWASQLGQAAGLEGLPRWRSW